MGWFIGIHADKPHKVSPGHRRGEAYLLILEGSAELTLDDTDTHMLGAGDEVGIADGQLHAVIAGPEGFNTLLHVRPTRRIDRVLHNNKISRKTGDLERKRNFILLLQ